MVHSYSQAGQDLFGLYMLHKKGLPKTYLDIGCQHPIHVNNSYLLEQHGWQGLSIDKEQYHNEFLEHRSNPFYQADVTTIDWDMTLRRLPFYNTNTIDFLSFDVDDATHDAFLHFPFDKIRFHAICIEHDSYRVGNELKEMIRSKLTELGYTLVCADVVISGHGAFEDWWVDEENVDTTLVSKIQCCGKNYIDICDLLQSQGITP